ncbi:hypothetical protein HF086_008426 [Spodoptera exigua]|uniref:Uncharacterized protein n=1 Tax=Spodoptera exigua TaxID=7107 RepID=A0A922SJM0_SPOEX|nr:hypothetical protein HF086_008426 [Spodoptera exigua]
MEIEKKLNDVEVESRPAVRIVTSYDGEQPGAWSRAGPDARVLARAKALARSALDYMDKKLSECADNVLNMFVPSYAGYNVLIHVARPLVAHCGERLDAAPPRRDLPPTPAGDIIPVRLIDEHFQFLIIIEFPRNIRELHAGHERVSLQPSDEQFLVGGSL